MYQCDKGHKFIHAAKLTMGSIPHSQLELLTGLIDEGMKDMDPQVKPLVDVFQSIVKVMGEGTFERYVCPECRSHNYTEYDEPKPEISSVVSVDLAQVDSYLAKGYVVHELYAKTATLKQLKNPKNSPNCKRPTDCGIEVGARDCVQCSFGEGKVDAV